MRFRSFGLLMLASAAAMTSPALAMAARDYFAPPPGSQTRRRNRAAAPASGYRSKGKPARRQSRRNMLHVSKRVRRRHRRAA